MFRIFDVDGWAWVKGTKFDTVVAGLERRRVVDQLADRAADRLAGWFGQHVMPHTREYASPDFSTQTAEGNRTATILRSNDNATVTNCGV